MDARQATDLARQVTDDTGLEARVGDDGDGESWVDVEVPVLGDEVRSVVTAHDQDDWPWLFEKYVRARLSPGG